MPATALSKINRSSASKLHKQAQIFALHGFTGCGEDFAEFSPLCGSACTWTCPNLPGHGSEPSLVCTPEATLAWLTQRAHPLPKPRILLGYSMGSRAALQLALAAPAHWDGLILISANPGIETEQERAQRASSDAALAQRILTDGVPAFLNHWQQTPIIRSQERIRSDWRAAMQQNRLQHTAKGLAASLKQFGQAACPNLWPKLSEINCPSLLISGAQDSKYCAIAERMQAALPQAQWAKISQAGHMPHLEAPEATASIIRPFLSQL